MLPSLSSLSLAFFVIFSYVVSPPRPQSTATNSDFCNALHPGNVPGSTPQCPNDLILSTDGSGQCLCPDSGCAADVTPQTATCLSGEFLVLGTCATCPSGYDPVPNGSTVPGASPIGCKQTCSELSEFPVDCQAPFGAYCAIEGTNSTNCAVPTHDTYEECPSS